MHVHEDHFLPEVVDRDSGEPLAEGEVGVLVFTALTKQALPLMRYWTGDLSSLSSEPCSAGARSSGWARSGPAPTTC